LDTPPQLRKRGPEAGLVVLESIDRDAVADYQPYWAVRATSAKDRKKTVKPQRPTTAAIGLAEDPAVREFLLQKRG